MFDKLVFMTRDRMWHREKQIKLGKRIFHSIFYLVLITFIALDRLSGDKIDRIRIN